MPAYKKIDTDYIIREYNKYRSMEKISTEMNVSKWKIREELLRDGIKTRNNSESLKYYYSIQENKDRLCNQLRKYQYDPLNKEAISQRSKETYYKCQAIRTALGIPHMSKKYFYDSKYFKFIDDEHKAYWLGFIAADGNISFVNEGSRHCYRLKLCLNKIDENHIMKFASDIKYHGPIKNYKNRNMVELDICNKDIVSSLIDHGIIPRKTFLLEWNLLPSSILENKYLMSSFIRGYYDGDGTISMVGKNKKYFIMSIFGCSKSYINGMRNVIYRFTGFIPKLLIHRLKSGKYGYQIIYSSKESLLAFGSFLYSNSTIYLERKYVKYLEMINYLKTQRSNAMWDARRKV